MAVRQSLLPIFLFFVLVNGLATVFRTRLEGLGYDIDVLLIANLLLCAMTSFSFYLLYKGMKASTTAGFLKSVYGSFIFKLVLVASLVLGYVFLMKDQVNKHSLITAMFLYLVYTFVETRSLLKLFRQKKNA
jgi:hypothetical protein